MGKLVRNGEDHGEVVVVFDDGHKITAKVGATTTRRVEGANGYSPGAAAGWLAQRINPNSFSPISFVDAKPKERLAQVLEASDLRMDFRDLIAAARPMKIESLVAVESGSVAKPLDAVDLIDKRIREYRTEVNRDVKTKRAHIEELEQTLPASSGAAGATEAVESDPKPLRAELDRTKAELAERRSASKVKEKDRLANIDREANREETAAREELAVKLRDISKRRQEDTAKITEQSILILDEINAEYAPLIDDLNSRIARAETLAKQAETAATTRAAILKARETAAMLEDESTALTEAIERLAKLKIRVMEKLPVPGLGVFDGELYWKQIRVETLNTAELIDVAMRIAEVTAGQIRLICLDGMERLGRKKRELVEQRAAESDCQFFITRVVDDAALSVESDGEQAVADDLAERVAVEAAEEQKPAPPVVKTPPQTPAATTAPVAKKRFDMSNL